MHFFPITVNQVGRCLIKQFDLNRSKINQININIWQYQFCHSNDRGMKKKKAEIHILLYRRSLWLPVGSFQQSFAQSVTWSFFPVRTQSTRSWVRVRRQ